MSNNNSSALRMLLFASLLVFLSSALAFAERVPGTCDGTIEKSCSIFSASTCEEVAGCTLQYSGGSCSLKSGAWNYVTNAPCTVSGGTTPPGCHEYIWYCPGGGDNDCCEYDASPFECGDPGVVGVRPCEWDGGTGQCDDEPGPTGDCEQYGDDEYVCEALGCDWEPLVPSCYGDSCTVNHPSGCCAGSPVCFENKVACDTEFDCSEMELGTCVSHFCSIQKTCQQCIPVGNTVNTCTSNGQCCSGGNCFGGLCVSCLPENQACTGAPAQGNCCTGMRCGSSDNKCHANRAPAAPPAPQLSPSTITVLGAANCVGNCPPAALAPDPDGDPVSLNSLQWYKSGSAVGTWTGSTVFDCGANGCAVGDSITAKSRACDNQVPNLCTESGMSNAVIVVDAPPSGSGDPQYMILAVLVALGVLVLAYMATYVFDAVVK